MRMLRFSLCSIALTVLISCSVSNARQGLPPVKHPDWEVTYERGYCFGSCPVYKLRVNAQGRVRYKGIANVPSPLHRTWVLQPSELQALRELLENLNIPNTPNIFNLSGSGCHLPTTCSPEITITYRAGPKRHKLTHSHGCMTCKEFTDAFGMDGLRDQSQCAHDAELNRLYFFEGKFEQLIFSHQPDLATSAMKYFGDDVPLNQTR